MDYTGITNETIWQIDWAKSDRQRFLKAMPAPKPVRYKEVAPGISANQVCGVDVSGSDRRSVKAYLVGRGDGRVLWWLVNEACHRLVHPASTLEHRMYWFHRRHMAPTIAYLEWRKLIHSVAVTIQREGILAGIRQTYRSFQARPFHGEAQ